MQGGSGRFECAVGMRACLAHRAKVLGVLGRLAAGSPGGGLASAFGRLAQVEL